MKSNVDGQTDIRDLKPLPETPGVYFFLGENEEILYIGKATVLRDRVRSYFAADILETRGPKIAKMLTLARRVAWESTHSVLEALLLESRLIKEHQPPYNTDAKDDKSYNHVVITEELFPRVLLVRGRDLSSGKFVHPIRSLYGPFPHGTELRAAVKIIRKIFPFRDTCVPMIGKPCFHRQLGLCPGVCTGEISARKYGKIVRRIERFFEGKGESIAKALEREMLRAAKDLRFEAADGLKRTLFALRHIQDVALLADADMSRGAGYESRRVRIEAYDVAHLMGEASVGVMTVVEGGRANADEYRVFTLRGNHQGNDLSALEEVLSRRLSHPEWQAPDIVAVDGNFLQVGIAEKLFAEQSDAHPMLLGVVKDSHHKPKDILNLPGGLVYLKADILLANAEAHRFAIRHHRRKLGEAFLKK